MSKLLNKIKKYEEITDRVEQEVVEFLSKVSEAHPNSPLASRYGKRSIKDTQIERVRKKHRTRMRKGGGR